MRARGDDAFVGTFAGDTLKGVPYGRWFCRDTLVLLLSEPLPGHPEGCPLRTLLHCVATDVASLCRADHRGREKDRYFRRVSVSVTTTLARPTAIARAAALAFPSLPNNPNTADPLPDIAA